MNLKLVKAVCLVILLVMVLFTGTTPVSAQSMAGMGNCASSPSPAQASVPLCCVTPDCPLVHTITAGLPPAPSQITISKVLQSVKIGANLPSESSCSLNQAPQQDTTQAIPRSPGANCPCRNSLQSEDPPLI